MRQGFHGGCIGHGVAVGYGRYWKVPGEVVQSGLSTVVDEASRHKLNVSESLHQHVDRRENFVVMMFDVVAWRT